MPHALPVAPAPITDQLLDALIGVYDYDHDKPLTDAEVALMFHATPGCLRELRTYRQLLGAEYARVWLDGAIEAAPNVVRLPANDRPEGAA